MSLFVYLCISSKSLNAAISCNLVLKFLPAKFGYVEEVLACIHLHNVFPNFRFLLKNYFPLLGHRKQVRGVTNIDKISMWDKYLQTYAVCKCGPEFVPVLIQ